MLNKPQIRRLLQKMNRFADDLEPGLFIKVGELEGVEYAVTDRQYHALPQDLSFAPAAPGTRWQGESAYCWFKGEFTPPEELAGEALFVRPHIGGYEALLFVDGRAFGTFNTKIVYTGHGNHYCDLLVSRCEAGRKIDVAIEYYAGHLYPGCHPGDTFRHTDFSYEYQGVDICVKDRELIDFYFDLLTVLKLADGLENTDSFRLGELITALYEVYKIVNITVADTPAETLRASIRAAAPILKDVLAKKNGDSCGRAAIIGHSHMDTAWLWHVGETVKKCARTYSNQLALMEEYPEYKFIQSSACHGNFILQNYPELFERIKEAVAAGRYEPNGAVWVECDCNITSGEAMVRQFLWGQRFTRKHFGYTSNCFWLPDTFGYSAAIPQIMKGCGVDYFLTTKISWNDTNPFPFDTFYWQGIDGTKVFTHFNTTHHNPSPEDVIDRMQNVNQKTVADRRLLAFGYGDGGGGPMFEELEYARRVRDLAGCPKTEYMAVGDFMRTLEAELKNPNTYRGELYLELHRGTLTNQHTIKRNNRKAELALRDLEFVSVSRALAAGEEVTSEKTAPLWESLLINQFHDILPGTCINRAHEESRAQTAGVIRAARAETAALLGADADDACVTLVNTLSFDREDVVFLDYKGMVVDGDYPQQVYTDLDGDEKLMVAGVRIPAFSSVTLPMKPGMPESGSVFAAGRDTLETPFASVRFAENGTIASFTDLRAGRELVAGRPFNTLVMAEDLPSAWDNWDLDADITEKFRPVSDLVYRETVSAGPVAYIVRAAWRISERSTLTQDIIFFASSPEVRFDTRMNWKDDHRFLKACFDTDVYDDFARHEIQFGCVKRPTTRNNSIEEAKFEVVNHKYTDLSEPAFGVTLLNDCKYGITVRGGSLQISLHKGGVHPDYKGDKDGVHTCVYSFLPHVGGFSAETVARPAYMLNVPVVAAKGTPALAAPAGVEAPNVIVESVKPCEDGGRAYILRLYEAEGSYTETALRLPAEAKAASLTNMLEEPLQPLDLSGAPRLVFRPFEIKTVKVEY